MARRPLRSPRPSGNLDRRAVRQDDPSVVRREYADETRLATRKRAHQLAEGPDAREIVFAGCAVPAFDGPIRVRRAPVVLVAERE
jgi:hypothetical protein